MSEIVTKSNAIINGSIIITVHLIFWVIVTIALPLISIATALIIQSISVTYRAKCRKMQQA